MLLPSKYPDTAAVVWGPGPATRCIGSLVPPPQPWQFPLPPPPPPADLADFEEVATHIRSTLRTPNPEFPPDEYDGEPYCEPSIQPLLRCATEQSG